MYINASLNNILCNGETNWLYISVYKMRTMANEKLRKKRKKVLVEEVVGALISPSWGETWREFELIGASGRGTGSCQLLVAAMPGAYAALYTSIRSVWGMRCTSHQFSFFPTSRGVYTLVGPICYTAV